MNLCREPEQEEEEGPHNCTIITPQPTPPLTLYFFETNTPQRISNEK
jgi:hypothetical protein